MSDMTQDGERAILQEIGGIKTMLTELQTQLRERQPRCNSHGKDIEDNTHRISALEKIVAGLKAWIAATAAISGIAGTVAGWIIHGISARSGG